MAGLVVMTRPWQLALLALLASPALGLQVQVHRRPGTVARARRAASLPTVTMAQEAFEEYETPPQWTRRAAIGGGALSVVSLFETREPKKDSYGLWGTLPIGPYKTKATAPMETIVPGKVWSFDQKFGILNVQVPSRMVVIKLSPASGGGLFVYNPIAATRDLLDQVKALEREHGPVRHIVLGTVAIEHKTYAGVFSQKFKQAQVWLQPGQYAVPFDLPSEWLGFPTGRTRPLPYNNADTPWAADFEHETLGPFISRDGAFGETAFFHKETKTLLVTDTVVQLSDQVPPIYKIDKKPLLYHARDTISQVIDPNDESALMRGWRRVQLFGLYFMPSAISVHAVDQALAERRTDINGDFAGIYPWDWVGDDVASFNAIRGSKKDSLLVAPILQVLILNRNPVEVLDWADRVARWDFKRVVPAHLKNDIPADGKAFRAAFSFLEEGGEPTGQPKPLAADLETLRGAEKNLEAMGAIAPCPGKMAKGDKNRAALLAASKYGSRGGLTTPKAPLTKPALLVSKA